MKQNYTVALYMVDKAWGGQEEGGWWYHCGEIIKPIRIFQTEERAWKYAHRMQRLIDCTLNKGRRPIDSVLSEGMYDVQVHEVVPPHHYPSVRPH